MDDIISRFERPLTLLFSISSTFRSIFFRLERTPFLTWEEKEKKKSSPNKKTNKKKKKKVKFDFWNGYEKSVNEMYDRDREY